MESVSQVTETTLDEKPLFHPLFSDEDADIVLISTDGTRFRLPRFTLKKTSGYFRDIIFSKPFETNEFIIPFLTEPLEHVLLMISGLPTTPPSTFDKIEATINVMQFLDAQGPLTIFRYCVLPTCCDKPIKLYELGVKLGWPELEQRGAELSLPINIRLSKDLVIDAQLSEMSGPMLMKLMNFHQKRRVDFRKELKSLGVPMLHCTSCGKGERVQVLGERLLLA